VPARRPLGYSGMNFFQGGDNFCSTLGGEKATFREMIDVNSNTIGGWFP